MTQPAGSLDSIATVFDRIAELEGGPLRQYLDTVFPARGDRALDLGAVPGLAVLPAMRKNGLNNVAPVWVFGSDSQLREVVRWLRAAHVIVADLTYLNPDLMYVLGLAHGLGRCPILIHHEDTERAVQPRRAALHRVPRRPRRPARPARPPDARDPRAAVGEQLDGRAHFPAGRG